MERLQVGVEVEGLLGVQVGREGVGDSHPPGRLEVRLPGQVPVNR